MQTHFGIGAQPGCRGGFVSIGNFDGVHLGHRQMIGILVNKARAGRVPAVVFTFDPHPIALLRPGFTPVPLTTISRRLELLAELGVDQVVVYPTDQRLLGYTPEDFFEKIIQGELAAQGLVEGPNFFFGKDRAGDIDLLRSLCGQHGLQLEIAPPVMEDGRLISSSEIRREIQEGAVSRAGRWLGRPYQLQGRVVEGDRRGRDLGFPTANLIEVPTLLPAEGVYAGRVVLPEGKFAAGINIGANPTFGVTQKKLEVHLLDYSGDLYGQTLQVQFIDRLRETRQFAGLQELKHQLQRDLLEIREICACQSAGHPE